MIAVDPQRPKGIVWLASYPKSGNTWLRMFLYQLARIRRGLPRAENEINDLDRVSQNELAFGGIYEGLLHKPVAAASEFEVAQARSLAQAAIAANFPSLAFLRTHSLLGVAYGAPTINQSVSAGAVYLVRDPRDVAVSLAQYAGKPLDFAIDIINRHDAFALGNDPRDLWGSWSQHVESWAGHPDPSLLVVRYEDLLSKPKDTFGAIAQHLRQPAKPEEIAEAVSASSFGELRRQEKQYGFAARWPDAKRFFVNGRSRVWRDKMSAAQAERIVAAHGPTMRKLGYLD
jgi:hypothetical protein